MDLAENYKVFFKNVNISFATDLHGFTRIFYFLSVSIRVYPWQRLLYF